MKRIFHLRTKVQVFWNSRSGRERIAVLVGTGVVSGLLGWSLVWTPIDEWASSRADQLVRVEETALIVRSGRDDLAKTSRAEEEPAEAEQNVSPMRQVQESAEKLSIDGSIAQRRPTDNGGVRVRFDKIPFSTLIEWVDSMEGADLVTRQADLSPVDSSAPDGQVRATLVLEGFTR